MSDTTAEPSNNSTQTGDGRFKPGNPGGPGRREGSRNKATLLLDALADGEAETILSKQIEKAKEGDQRAAEFILGRAWPARRGHPVSIGRVRHGRPARASGESAMDTGIVGLKEHLRVRRGDLMVVTGIPGHGKTSFVNEMVCSLALQVGGPVTLAFRFIAGSPKRAPTPPSPTYLA